MVVPRTTRLQFVVVRPNFWLSVHGCAWVSQLELSLSVKIYGCPSDNCIRFFGCPATCLVVPGARTTEISNAGHNVLRQCEKKGHNPCQNSQRVLDIFLATHCRNPVIWLVITTTRCDFSQQVALIKKKETGPYGLPYIYTCIIFRIVH